MLIAKRFVGSMLVLPVAYLGSYGWFRSTHIERRDGDGRNYIIFPRTPALYYFYRPLTDIDVRVTGIGVHIGPHRS